MPAAGMFFSPGSTERSRVPRRLRVLVADDDRDGVLTLLSLLRDEGHDAQGVYSGSYVLPTVQAFDPDAVVLDIALPGMTGWDVARQIRQSIGPGRPLLVALTGHYRKAADRILAKMVGFDCYFIKPCDPKELLASLDPHYAGPER